MNGFGVARYLPNGDLDLTFGEGGKVLVDMGTPTRGVSVRVLSDNSMIVCGASGFDRIVIAHIGSNGDVDVDTSGTEAKYTNSYMAGQAHPTLRKVLFAQPDQLAAIAATARESRRSRRRTPLLEGLAIILMAIARFFWGALQFFRPTRSFGGLRVLAVGDVGELVSPRLIALAGYNTRADPDPSFGSDGQTIQHAGSDKIEVAAADYRSRNGRTVVVTHKHDYDLPVLRVARFLDDGTLDGFVSYYAWLTGSMRPWYITPQDVVLRKDTIIVGSAFHEDVGLALVVVRIKESGGVDLDFGDADGVGVVLEGSSQRAFNSVEIDARSRIIAAGRASDDFCLARFTPHGTFDQDFNQGAIAVTNFDGEKSTAEVARIDSAISERIVVAGEAGRQFALVRHLDDGSLDSAFGSNGKVRTTFLADHNSRATDIAFDSEQRVVAAGSVGPAIVID